MILQVRIEKVEYDVATDGKPVSTMGDLQEEDATKPIRTGPWTLDELNHLVRLSTHKFPVGTPNRWQQMGDALHRRPEDVTAMIGRLKHMDPNGQQAFAFHCSLSIHYLPSPLMVSSIGYKNRNFVNCREL